MTDVAAHSSVDGIVAQIERLPTSWWQIKTRIIVGTATFFDAFDALAIASVLPVIAPLWKLAPQQIGWLISAGFLGQLLGALVFGWVAERHGRITAMVWSIALFSVMSLVCALAWDYNSLLAFRTMQGIGLGGEVPVAAVFISELARAQGRGRFVLLYELVFPVGLVAASLAGLWVVPHLGWPYMFAIGALPGFLALVLRRLLPEVPAVARGAWAPRPGGSRNGADRVRNTQGHGRTVAGAQAGRLHTRKASLADRPVWSVLSAANVGRLGNLVLRLFRQLWPLHLAPHGLPHRVQAAARSVAAVWADHAGCWPDRDFDLRFGHRPCRTATLVCVVLRGRRGGFGRACEHSHAHGRSRCSPI